MPTTHFRVYIYIFIWNTTYLRCKNKLYDNCVIESGAQEKFRSAAKKIGNVHLIMIIIILSKFINVVIDIDLYIASKVKILFLVLQNKVIKGWGQHLVKKQTRASQNFQGLASDFIKVWFPSLALTCFTFVKCRRNILEFEKCCWFMMKQVYLCLFLIHHSCRQEDLCKTG